VNYLSTKTEVTPNLLSEVMDCGQAFPDGCFYSCVSGDRMLAGRTVLGSRFKVWRA
jgi:hypothetical protein